MCESRCGMATNSAGQRLRRAGSGKCCPVCALENKESWRGCCFDVHSSMHRKPCPAKNWPLGGAMGAQGRRLASQLAGPLTAAPLPKSGRGRARAPCGPGPSFFFLPCRLSTLRHWPKSRDHRRQNCSSVFPARPELPHHNNSAQVALPNASVRNSPSVLTVQAHDENLPYPLLARRGKAILWKTAATAAAATVTASHSSMKRVSARTSPASSSPCLKRQVKPPGRRSRLLTSAHACLRLSLVDI